MAENRQHDSAPSESPHESITREEEGIGYYQIMETALFELAVEKEMCTADEVRRYIEAMDSRSPEGGARVVARAWTDPEFKSRLLGNGSAACEELGISLGPMMLVAVENTEKVHNVIVCTLCSCYPRTLLGLPPDWYKSQSYRRRVVNEPRAVLAEFGTHLADDVEVRVHDSTADMRYIVLPQRPPETEGLSEGELVDLVSRDTMIGVTKVTGPSQP